MQTLIQTQVDFDSFQQNQLYLQEINGGQCGNKTNTQLKEILYFIKSTQWSPKTK